MAGKSYATAGPDKKYQAEMDLGTLIEAERIKKDAARFKAAMECRKEKMAAMQAISKDGK